MKNDLDYAARYAASVLSRHIALNKHSLGCAVAVAQLKDAVDLELTDEELLTFETVVPQNERNAKRLSEIVNEQIETLKKLGA